MIQDLRTSVAQFARAHPDGVADGDRYVSRLGETLTDYAAQTMAERRGGHLGSTHEAARNAGYIFGLIGQPERARELFDRYLDGTLREGGAPRVEALREVIAALRDFGAARRALRGYEQELERAESVVKSGVMSSPPEDRAELRLRICHEEADLECAEGDLPTAHAEGRHRQGRLAQKLGEHRDAIQFFEAALREEIRDPHGEVKVANYLAIVESYEALGDTLSARSAFVRLIGDLVPPGTTAEAGLPRLFLDNYSTLQPYFDRLGCADLLAALVEVAAVRLQKVGGKTLDVQEVFGLVNVLESHSLARADYGAAVAVYDLARERFQGRGNLSRTDHAELAVKARDIEKAKGLIADEISEVQSPYVDHEKRDLALANVSLQVGALDQALDRLDLLVARVKKTLVFGSLGSLLEARRAQVTAMKAAIGPGYLAKLRSYLGDRLEALAVDTARRLGWGPGDSGK